MMAAIATISIHAACEGGDARGGTPGKVTVISIHAAREGGGMSKNRKTPDIPWLFKPVYLGFSYMIPTSSIYFLSLTISSLVTWL